MVNYVLSTGEVTTRVERYILDLFSIFLTIYPNDVPNTSIGFDFVLGDVKKDELPIVIGDKVNTLIATVREYVPAQVDITLDNIELVSYSQAIITISVNGNTDNFEIDLNENIE